MKYLIDKKIKKPFVLVIIFAFVLFLINPYISNAQNGKDCESEYEKALSECEIRRDQAEMDANSDAIWGTFVGGGMIVGAIIFGYFGNAGVALDLAEGGLTELFGTSGKVGYDHVTIRMDYEDCLLRARGVYDDCKRAEYENGK